MEYPTDEGVKMLNKAVNLLTNRYLMAIIGLLFLLGVVRMLKK